MGTINSKDTRRISFDNKFALTPVIAVQKSIEDIVELGKLSEESPEEIDIKENNTTCEPHDTNGDYWSRRIENLRKEHQAINKIIELEYEKTVENTTTTNNESHNTGQEKIHKMKPCFDLRAKIVQCYEDNPRQPLVCSAMVQAFIQCVKSYRAEH